MGAGTIPADLPFEVIETERGRTYRLPPRRILALRLLAVMPLASVAILGVFLAKFYVNDVAQQPVNSWFWALFIVLAAVWLLIAYTMLDVAASFWGGQAEIEITPDGVVSAYDRAGWFRICLCWFKPGEAARLILAEIATKESARDLYSWFVAGLWQLSVEDRAGEKGWLALGYPRETLAALAEQLARELSVAPPDATEPERIDEVRATPAAQAPVPVVTEPGFPNRDVTEQPLKSRVVLERHPDGVTLTFPRLGVSGPNGAPFCLGLFIAAVSLALTVATVVSWIIQGKLEFPPGLVIGPGLLAVGVGSMLHALNAGRKRMVFAVVGDTLLALEAGPLGSTRCEFTRADLLDIACRPNDHVPDLLIVTNDRTAVALLAGRDEAELKWVATILRQALGIPSEPPEFRTPPDTPSKPWEAQQQGNPGEKVAVTVGRNGLAKDKTPSRQE